MGHDALKTPADLGQVIRQRRKVLGWDQARLAYETGVSRQWVIDIEKGKPRAELQLVLRVMNVLGIPLTATLHSTAPEAAGIPHVDLNAIIERHRGPTQGPARHIGTTGQLSYAQILELARQGLPPTPSTAPLTVHESPADYAIKPKKAP